jgi:hypothetical protein
VTAFTDGIENLCQIFADERAVGRAHHRSNPLKNSPLRCSPAGRE